MKKVEEFDEESLANQINKVFLPLGIFFVFFQTYIMKLLLFVLNTPKQMRNFCHHALGHKTMQMESCFAEWVQPINICLSLKLATLTRYLNTVVIIWS